jgi:two-component system, sensor histidine kinase and response regulator
MLDETEDAGHGTVTLDPGAVTALFGMVGEDRELVRDIVDAFLEDAPARLAEISSGLENGDAALVRRAAHTLKANGLTFGALAFAEACRRLEEAAKGDDLGDTGPMVADVERSWWAARPAVEALAAGADA